MKSKGLIFILVPLSPWFHMLSPGIIVPNIFHFTIGCFWSLWYLLITMWLWNIFRTSFCLILRLLIFAFRHFLIVTVHYLADFIAICSKNKYMLIKIHVPLPCPLLLLNLNPPFFFFAPNHTGMPWLFLILSQSFLPLTNQLGSCYFKKYYINRFSPYEDHRIVDLLNSKMEESFRNTSQ